jgi:molybdopterin-guanine dinucleotide biosynthesis protein A
VITAGGRSSPELEAATGTPWKALAFAGKRRLIDIVVDAARGLAPRGIAVVGDTDVRAHLEGRVERAIDADDDGVENIRRALHAFPNAERLLYLTCDVPFIDTPGLDDFVRRSHGVPLTMALAGAAAYEAMFPAAPLHTVALAGERVANGNAFLIDGSAIAPLETVAGRFFHARKNLARLALLLGPALCLRFACKTLRIADIERRARQVLGFDVRAIRDAAPGLCYDIDTVADWAYAHTFARAEHG